MRLLVTGAENSGTGLVATLLRLAGATVTHRAVPHIEDREPLREFLYPDALVFVVRHHVPQERSQQHRSGRLRSTGAAAVQHIARYLERPGALFFFVTYEAIIHEWPRSFTTLCDELGLDPAAALGFDVRDENRKHYADRGMDASADP